MRILLPETPEECRVSDYEGKGLNDFSWEWNGGSKTGLLSFENDPEGIKVDIRW
jgi:hypothetical protein